VLAAGVEAVLALAAAVEAELEVELELLLPPPQPAMPTAIVAPTSAAQRRRRGVPSMAGNGSGASQPTARTQK
jgi:hypothetical protein